jgi:hypothetical protein
MLASGLMQRDIEAGRTVTWGSTRMTSWRRRECTQPSQERKSSSLCASTSICAAPHQAQSCSARCWKTHRGRAPDLQLLHKHMWLLRR